MILFVLYTVCIVPASFYLGYIVRDFVIVTIQPTAGQTPAQQETPATRPMRTVERRTITRGDTIAEHYREISR